MARIDNNLFGYIKGKFKDRKVGGSSFYYTHQTTRFIMNFIRIRLNYILKVNIKVRNIETSSRNFAYVPQEIRY